MPKKIQPLTKTKTRRFQIGPLGERYEDLLKEIAFLHEKTIPQIAKDLLLKALQDHKQQCDEDLDYLARKRGKTLEEFRCSIHLDSSG